MMNGLAEWFRFALAPVSPVQQRRLLAAFGLPGNVFAQPRSQIVNVVGVEAAESLLSAPNPAAMQASLDWASTTGNHVLTLADADYPRSLLEIADPPALLYVKGNTALLGRAALAVVGSRSPTAQGEANAEAFARYLSEAGLTIISGLAQGIDAAAHRGALAAQNTVAVIGTGIDRIYPASNAALAREIAEKGALVSEFPLGTPPARWNFPRRNRLIAGLSQGVLVVEATPESGSLITARLAAEAGREVFAIPGSIHSPLSRGCHRLIREGAKLVETAEDVLEELQGLKVRQPRRRQLLRKNTREDTRREIPNVSPEALRILECLGTEPRDIDTLALATGFDIALLNAHLLTLELEGAVARQSSGFARLYPPQTLQR